MGATLRRRPPYLVAVIAIHACLRPPRPARRSLRKSWDSLDQEEGRNSFAGRRTATIEPCILSHPATGGMGAPGDPGLGLVPCRRRSTANAPKTLHHQLQKRATEIHRLLQHQIGTIRAVKLDLFLDDG